MRKLAAIALLLMACTREEATVPATASAPAKPATPPPSADQARTIIMGSMEFGEFQFTEAAYSTPVSGAAMNDPQRQAARNLATHRTFSLDPDGAWPLKPDTFRTPGYPLVPAVYIILATLLVLDLVYLARLTSGVGFLIVLTGLPVYFLWRRGARN